eukprot:41577-Pleurochrysis_carterae.AAC.1
MDDMQAMSEYLAFETRAAAGGGASCAAHGSSKAVVTRTGAGIRVICTLIPPLIVEHCRQAHGREVLAVTFNMFTFNDRDGLDLPPLFRYADGQRAAFRELALQNLMGMGRRGGGGRGGRIRGGRGRGGRGGSFQLTVPSPPPSPPALAISNAVVTHAADGATSLADGE